MAKMDDGLTDREILEVSGRASVPLCERMHNVLSPENVPLAVLKSRQTAEVRAALEHYFQCGNCRSIGLASLLEKEMACETALLVCARNLGPISLYPERHESLEIVLAAEHVSGYWSGTFMLPYCTAVSCVAFRQFWANPIGANHDLLAHTAHELAALHKIFREARFNGIAEIRRLMCERVAAFIASIRMHSRLRWMHDEEFAFIEMEVNAICGALLA